MKGCRIRIFSFVGHGAYVAAAQCGCSSEAAAVDDRRMGERGCGPIKLFLQADGRLRVIRGLSFDTPIAYLKVSNTGHFMVLSTWLIPKAPFYKFCDKLRGSDYGLDTIVKVCRVRLKEEQEGRFHM